jgi:hypothetical protein
MRAEISVKKESEQFETADKRRWTQIYNDIPAQILAIKSVHALRYLWPLR